MLDTFIFIFLILVLPELLQRLQNINRVRNFVNLKLTNLKECQVDISLRISFRRILQGTTNEWNELFIEKKETALEFPAQNESN